MDKTYWTFAFASNNEWIGFIIFVTPADSALYLILTSIFNVFGALHFHGLSQFLLIQLMLWKVNLVASEVFNSEPYSTQFNGIKLLDFVIIFSLLILEWSGHQPKSVNRLLLLVFSSNCMIKIVSLCTIHIIVRIIHNIGWLIWLTLVLLQLA